MVGFMAVGFIVHYVISAIVYFANANNTFNEKIFKMVEKKLYIFGLLSLLSLGYL